MSIETAIFSIFMKGQLTHRAITFTIYLVLYTVNSFANTVTFDFAALAMYIHWPVSQC